MTDGLLVRSALVLELCDYLRAQLATRTESYAQNVIVGRTVPNPRPVRFVQFTNRGGTRVNVALTRSIVDVNTWSTASDELEADNLAGLVVGLLELANSLVIADVSVTTYPQDLPQDGGQPRRFARLTITHRATAA